jgi:PAS domain S-box-containing protein
VKNRRIDLFIISLLSIILGLSLNSSKAQILKAGGSVQIDSMQLLIKKLSGTEKIDMINALAFELFNFDFSKSNKLITEALELSAKYDYVKGRGEALIYKGVYERIIGHPELSQKYFKEGIELSRKAENKKAEGYGLLQYGRSLVPTGKIDSAKLLYQQSYKVLRDSANPRELSTLYKSLGNLYALESDTAKEKDYFLRSAKIQEEIKDDRLLILIYTELAAYFAKFNKYDKANYYVQKVDNLIPAIGKSAEGVYEFKYVKASILIRQSQYEAALKLLSELKEYNDSYSTKQNQINLFIDIGYLFSDLGNYELSLINYYQALTLAEKSNYSNELARVTCRIAWVYYNLEQTQKAEDFAKRCLGISISNNYKTEEATAYNLLGLTFGQKNAFDSALYFFQKSLALRIQLNDPDRVISTLTSIGDLLQGNRRYQEAIKYYLRGSAMGESSKNLMGVASTSQKLGQVYINLGDLKKALNILDKAEAISKKINANPILVDVYKNKADLYKASNRVNQALAYFERYDRLKDSLSNSAVGSRIAGLQSQYETNIKNQEIDLLSKDRALQKSQLAHQEAIILLGFGGIAVLLIAMIYLFRHNRIVLRLNRDIREHNEEILSQNEEIQSQSEELHQQNEELDNRVKQKTTEIRDIFERVSDAFVALDKDWHYTFVNTKAEQIFNKPPGHLLGKKIWEEFPEGLGQRLSKMCHEAMATQQYIYFEEYSPYDRWFEHHIYPSPTGISIYFRDITERKKAEEAIRRAELQYRTIFDNAIEGIYQSAPEGTFITVNPAMAKIFGYNSPKEMMTEVTSISEQLYADPNDRRLLHEQIKEHGNSLGLVLRGLKKNKETIWIKSNAQAVFDLEGKVKYYEGTLEDITAKINDEIILKNKNEELAKVNEQMEQFLYSASHDLRSPITSILGLINISRLEVTDELILSYMAKIEHSAQKLDKVIRDIVDFSKTSYKASQSEKVDFKSLLEKIVAKFSLDIDLCKIRLEINCEDKAPFYSDNERLGIIIENLFRNSITFFDSTKSESFIEIYIRTDAERALIEITDNGIGINSTHLENIFKMFYRGSERSKGAGLGLFIVKESLRKLNANIEVVSNIGAGTTFRTQIPNSSVGKLINRKLMLKHSNGTLP